MLTLVNGLNLSDRQREQNHGLITELINHRTNSYQTNTYYIPLAMYVDLNSADVSCDRQSCLWEHLTFNTFEPSIFMTSVHPPPPHAPRPCLVMWQYIYRNLCRPNVQKVLFISFGPGETYNFIGSPHFEIFRSFQWGHRKAVLVRAP